MQVYSAQEVIPTIHELPDIRNEVLQLYNTRLKNSIKEGEEKLQLMQRSSFHLGIHQEPTLQFADSIMWGWVHHQNLIRVMKDATDIVKLLLNFLETTFEDIIEGHQELEAFIITYKDCVVDSDMAASMQQTLQRTFEYLNDFETRITCKHVPLKLRLHLQPEYVYQIPKLFTSLIIKGPVIIDRSALCVTSNTVHLHWEVAGQQSEVPNEEFNICVKNLDTDELRQSTCQSYNIQIEDLLPDTQYWFYVKRADDTGFLYGQWTDNIVLQTDISK
ncbi:Fibronectin type III domain-containing protein 11 [Collichthys lucidus]|uniref:Fibronectin type III domain-containing protein 11 n=1 Tax=Collichthys lucidus TaxID=240159 RepID=A0A4U5U9U7_COLLU|nr:Fibronectin type III domain-containing protein 11 [Collichthys lucidus]